MHEPVARPMPLCIRVSVTVDEQGKQHEDLEMRFVLPVWEEKKGCRIKAYENWRRGKVV